MFKLFKSSDDIVREIHNEVDTAQNRILAECKKIISENSSDGDKAERLHRIGFVNAQTVIEHNKKSKKLVRSVKQAKLLEHYSHKYPFQKFLTIYELDRICEKYNLIYAPVVNYIKDVPTKNLVEIENTPELNEDERLGDDHFINITNEYYGRKLPKNTPKRFRLPIEIKQEYINTNHSASRWSIINKWVHKSSDNSQFSIESHELEIIKRSGLFIAAPISHFDTANLTKKGKFSFLSISIIEQKDPIVFEFLKDDIIRVNTKWGLEGQDESLVNEKLN